MNNTRRDFIKQSSATVGGVVGASTLQAAEDQDATGGSHKPTLVVIYLRGGMDPLNVIVPYTDPMYYQLRPTISIPARDGDNQKGCLPLNNQFGLNPNLEALYPYFKNGMVAPIINAGSTHRTRSHFDAQDFMERAAPGVKSITEGWLNRYLTATKTADDSPLRAIAMRPTLPRSLRGEYPVLAVPGPGSEHAMSAFEDFYNTMGMDQTDQEQKFQTSKPGGRISDKTKLYWKASVDEATSRNKIISSGHNTIVQLRELNRIFAGGSRNAIAYPRGHVGDQLKHIAKVIKANKGLEIAAVDYNGWDHHIYQGGVEGKMADMLRHVGNSVAAFMEDLGSHAKRTMVLCMSEFGRTVAENGNNGSDHGHGGMMLAIGGSVKGKQIYGKWTGLHKRALWEGRDLPVHTDFRIVFAETLYKMFGFSTAKHNFFPGYRVTGKPVDFMDSMT